MRCSPCTINSTSFLGKFTTYSPQRHCRRALSSGGVVRSPLLSHLATHHAVSSRALPGELNNLSRLRDLLSEVSAQDAAAVLPDRLPPRRSEVWPANPVPTSSTSLSTSTTHPPASFSEQAGGDDTRTQVTITDGPTPQKVGNNTTHSSPHHPLCWYGGPPGAVCDVDYFTGAAAPQCNSFFRSRYFSRGQPTAPLLRCPACTAALLRRKQKLHGSTHDGSVAGQTGGDVRAPTTGQVWMDPKTLNRHLSWAHADQLYTAPELASYNGLVLQELLYSCGLASAPVDEDQAPIPYGIDHGSSEAVRRGFWKTSPARLVLSFDVANVEMGPASTALLDLLTSKELCRTFAQTPIAICATHELFIPFTCKLLHVLFQLARLHPASSLHVFAANASLESGDLTTSAYLNEWMLASPSRAIPPVLLVTRDGQQRQVAREMHSSAQRTLMPVGVVDSSALSSVATFHEAVQRALLSSMWTV